MLRKVLRNAGGMAALVLAASAGYSIDYWETEPNDSKTAANVFGGLLPGDSINGNSTSSTGVGLDYFRISTAADALGIYRYRLVLTTTGTAGHTGTIRGLNQVAAPAGPWPGPVGTPGTTDSTAQTSSTATTPPRFVQWYGFGKMEEIYYRVTGTSTTTADYKATLEKALVTPVDIGTYQPGTITITTVGRTTLDTDLWVYDSNLQAIYGYGNDDESTFGGGTGTTLQSQLVRPYAPGVYYLALSRFNLANDQGSPCDDDFRTGVMLDFPGGVLSSSSTTTATLANFAVIDSTGTYEIAGSGFGPYDINWYKFTVVPEPGTIAALGVGLLALAARRRRK